MAKLGTVYVVIKENMEPLKKGLKVAEQKVRKFAAFTVKSLKGIGRAVFNLKSAFVGVLAGALVKNAISVASGFDQMKLSLETITKGRGAETFEELNAWALKMPVSTQKAIESYIQMRAMGLEPTIDQMTTLVDASSALGAGTEGVQRIARALGQMAAKGKVSAEELMQLAEIGVPAMGILAAKFGNVETSTIKATDAIEALFEGMAKDYGGQSKLMQDRWAGLVQAILGYWNEFVRLVMQSGLMEYLEGKLRGIVGWLDVAMETGKLQEWAMAVKNYILFYLHELEMKWAEFIWWFETNWPTINIKLKETMAVIKKVGEAVGTVISAITTAIGWAKKLNAMSGGWLGKGYGEFHQDLGNIVGDVGTAISNPLSFFVKPMMTMSPAQPWKSGIQEMKDDISSVGGSFNAAFDATAIKQGLTALAWDYQGTAFDPNVHRRAQMHNQQMQDLRDAGNSNYAVMQRSLWTNTTASGMFVRSNRSGFQTGTRRVQNTGPAVVHKGEEIIPEHRARRGRGLSIGNLTFNIGGGNPMQTARQIRLQLEQLAARGA